MIHRIAKCCSPIDSIVCQDLGNITGQTDLLQQKNFKHLQNKKGDEIWLQLFNQQRLTNSPNEAEYQRSCSAFSSHPTLWFLSLFWCNTRMPFQQKTIDLYIYNDKKTAPENERKTLHTASGRHQSDANRHETEWNNEFIWITWSYLPKYLTEYGKIHQQG